MMRQAYLGDGLYAEYDGFQVKLMANNPMRPTDTVYLNAEVLDSFIKWAQAVTGETESDGLRQIELAKSAMAAQAGIAEDVLFTDEPEDQDGTARRYLLRH